MEGERDPAKLAALRDRRCKKTGQEIADHLTGTWRDEHLFNLAQVFELLQFLDKKLNEYEAKVAQMFEALAAAVAPPENPPRPPAPGKKLTAKEQACADLKAAVQKIMSIDLTVIPGIGYGTAAVIASELGSNFDCFPDEYHFASYIGLAPYLGKSAGKNVRQKKRCKNTSRAGRALRMAAATLYRSQTELGAFFRNVARQTDKKTAVKATARRMAHMIYRGVRYGQDYIDNGAEAFEARLRERTVRTVNRLIKSYNISSSEILATASA